MNKTVWVTMWRTEEGIVWNEVGSHANQEQAQYAADELKIATGLQTTIMEWRNSPFEGK
jgi:hypothetical protein